MNDVEQPERRDVLSRLCLKGRNAVVTGGTRGIGYAIAKGLTEAGARVAVTCLNAPRDSGWPNEAYELLVQGDVSRPQDVKRVADEVIASWGSVDILVNNAGINIVGAAEDFAGQDFDRVMDINFKGVFLCCQEFGRHMIKARRGSIINIGSMSADIVNRPSEHAIYNASKAAVHMLSKCLAVEWAEFNVRVNVIAPGFHSTAMVRQVMDEDPENTKVYWIGGTAQRRIADPSELAGPAVLLASDASSFMTGAVLTSDGGYTLV
jgi:NAD(P)-dependent dehydrogenase (short-subunit alcohol dehydrogenase family)